MARRLFTLLSAASLVLCVATVFLWGRSATWTDDLRAASVGGRFWHASSDQGRMSVETFDNWPID